MDRSKLMCENAAIKIKELAVKYKVPLITSFVVGILCYLYVFTNKFVNVDEIYYLFGKGVTVSSGRWGLEILRFVIPDYSMPWLHGISTLFLISVSVCFIIDIFEIKGDIWQGLLAAAVVSFPSLIGTMSFMFTSSSYGVAFLCAVIAVWLAKKKGFWSIAGAALLLCFTLSIYQAYITVAASFLLVLVISMLLRDDTEIKDILKKGLRYLLVIISAVGLYFLITFIILNVSKTFFNSYAVAQISHSRGITTGLVVVYKKFASYFVKGDVGLINTDLSKSMHFVSCVMAFAAIVAVQIKQKNAAKAILTWFLIALMPLSINFFSITNSFVHTLMLYSFVSVYILAIVAINAAPKDNARLGKEVICIALALIAANNIYIANRSYLQLNITYENAYSFYTSLAAEIKMTPGFEEGTKVAIIGENDNLLYNCADFADSDIFGIERSVINAINRETFIKYYVGFNAEFAGYELQEQIKQSQEFAAMPVYPYYGSVQKIGDCIVVKLS